MDRYRLFSLTTYLLSSDLLAILSSQKNIRNYAFILHDKDIKDDCSLVEPHIHLLVRLHNPTTCNAVRRLFPFKPNTFVQYVKSDNIYNYLTHDGFEDKVQYDEKDIVSNDLTYWQSLTLAENKNQKTVNLINDLLNGVDMYTMLCTYGRDFVLNINKYKAFAELLRPQLHTCDEKLNELALEQFERNEIAQSFSQMDVLSKKR